MPLEIDRELLDELRNAGNLYCKFGAQLREWGMDQRNAVYRARHDGVAIEIIRLVLTEKWGHPECSTVKLMRDHFNRTCRCPKRR